MLTEKKIAELVRKRDFLYLMIARLENLSVGPSTQDAIIGFEQDIMNYDVEINKLRELLKGGTIYV